MNFDGLFQFRIAQRQKRLGLQISRKDGKPDSGEREHHGNIHQTRDGVRGELRTREPKEIDQAHEDKPDRDFRKQLRTAFDISREQRKERHKEMEDQDEYGDDAPGSIKPAAVETDFLRQIAGPDDQELRE